ncbi:hypothetical protein [Stakelama marina]|uniref:Uncharacterized protein n=1 Tax=Stakelama marina TaxID=2826939 RepID=A0A8T4IAM4_9SPHN|nr:hypothetical protein [Stakelama marina]MBR0551600.1 hypothetical protein [Stakelama marina]
MRKAFAALLALSALTGATAAQAAEPAAPIPCVNRDDAASLVQLIAPDLLQAAGQKCSSTLPASALLRNQTGAMLGKYRRAAAGAWPGAQRALQGVAGADISGLLSGDFARTLVGPMLAPMFTQNIQPADCRNLNTIVTMIEPLPAENLGKLFVAIYDMAERGRVATANGAGGIDLPLRICTNQQG